MSNCGHKPLLLLAVSLLAGCTATQHATIDRYGSADRTWGLEELHRELATGEAVIVTADARWVKATGIVIRSDSTFFNDSKGTARVIPSHDITRFEKSNHIWGGVQGLLIGATGGVLIGAGVMSAARPSGPGWTGWDLAWGAIIGGDVGLIGGLTYGLIKGSTISYELAPDTARPRSSIWP